MYQAVNLREKGGKTLLLLLGTSSNTVQISVIKKTERDLLRLTGTFIS